MNDDNSNEIEFVLDDIEESCHDTQKSVNKDNISIITNEVEFALDSNQDKSHDGNDNNYSENISIINNSEQTLSLKTQENNKEEKREDTNINKDPSLPSNEIINQQGEQVIIEKTQLNQKQLQSQTQSSSNVLINKKIKDNESHFNNESLKISKKTLSPKRLIAITSTVLLLGIIGYFFNFNQNQEEVIFNKTTINQIVNQLKSKRNKKDKMITKKSLIKTPALISGQDKIAKGAITWEYDKASTLLKIIFKGNKPPELSAIEIAQGIAPKVWITKIAIEPFNMARNKNITSLVVPAVIFLEQGNNKLRIIGKANINTNEQNNTKMLYIRVVDGYNSTIDKPYLSDKTKLFYKKRDADIDFSFQIKIPAV